MPKSQFGQKMYTGTALKALKLRPAEWTLLVLICTFAIFFIYYVIRRHVAFESFGYDLGNVTQSIWNTVHGRPLVMTTMENIPSRWALHFEPVLLIFTPLFALFPSPITLIVAQVLIVAVGAIPIFLMGRDTLMGEGAGVVYAGVYLMFPALQAAVVFDFHGATIAMTFLAFALWTLLQKRYIAFGIWAFLAMSCKEDMSLLVLMMGLYILVIQRQWRAGSITIVAAVLWFLIANFIIVPFFSPIQENIHIARYSSLGDSMGEVIWSFFTRPIDVLSIAFAPSRIPYWIRLTMPVAFTSFLGLPVFLMALPSIAINTLSSDSLVYRPDVFHYTAPIVPFVVVSSISGVAWLGHRLGGANKRSQRRWMTRLLIVVVGASLGYHILAGYTPLSMAFRWPLLDSHDRLTEEMLAKIPPMVSVSAQNTLTPHLAARSHIYIFPKLEGAEYIALDTSADYFPLRERDEYCREVRWYISDSSYGVVYASNGLFLLQRGVSDKVSASTADICSKVD